MIASIPSPSTGTIDLGPFVVHMYGLMLLLAISAAVALTGIRYVRRGGDWDLVLRVAVWGVAAGIVGARLYHDATSWSEVPDPKWKGIFEVWKGGLGIWGGILFDAIAGSIVVRRSVASVSEFADAAAPGILLARRSADSATSSTRSSTASRPTGPGVWRSTSGTAARGYEADSTFHPIFLYEADRTCSVVGVLLLIDWRFRVRAPGALRLYVSLYTFAGSSRSSSGSIPRTSSAACG